MAERYEASVEWLPFDLHPEYPPEGVPQRPDRAEGARRLFERYDLVYNPPSIVPNTMQALRLTELARERGLHPAMHDRVMDAYWAEGRQIGDADVLREIAREVGLNPGEVDDVLAGDAFRDRVQGLTAEAHSIGVNGVPAFLLDRRLLVLGAQPRDVFERAFAQIEAPGSTSEAPPDP